MEGRIIEYRHPGGGLDYHNSPLIGEIPSGEYTILHRSIDQLRLLNDRHALSEISNTDLRTTIISNHLEYKYTNNNLDEDDDGREVHYLNNDKHLVVVQQIDKDPKFEQKIENETFHHGSSSPRSQISSHSDEEKEIKDDKKKVLAFLCSFCRGNCREKN